jgi:septal ring factor EnvC (AmiA/AmiB activator)
VCLLGWEQEEAECTGGSELTLTFTIAETGGMCARVMCLRLLLQSELVKAQEEAGALREGSSDLASLQAQLAAAQEEASGLRNDSEEVEYLQAQLRRTLRQVVELQRQVRKGLCWSRRGGPCGGLGCVWTCVT